MNVLSDTLRVIRLAGAVFFTARVSAPWSFQSPSPAGYARLLDLPTDCITLFHIVVNGRCWFRVAGQPAFQARPGDVVIFPRAEAHQMGSQAQALPRADVTQQVLNFVEAAQPEEGIPHLECVRGDEVAHFVCGYLHCDQRFNPLASSLPPVLVVRVAGCSESACTNGAGTLPPVALPSIALPSVALPPVALPSVCVLTAQSGDWLDVTRCYMIEETANQRAGSSTMLARQTELFFMEVLRRYMQQLPPDQTGWLAGLRDPDVGQVIQLMHSQPAHPWTVTELAQAAALSRSALAQRFTTLMGESPMQYLLGWRMQLAQSLLDQTNLSLREIADQVGYESEVSFNRAFKRTVGQPPATWRRQAVENQ